MIGLRLNADLGEGLDDIDHRVMPFIDQANIACGGHAGDLESIARTVDLAHRCGVAIGAHPSYLDRAHFGRRSMEVAGAQLEEQLFEQVQRVANACDALGAQLQHVKAHGALYNDCANHPDKLHTLMRVTKAFNCALMLQCLPDMQNTLDHANSIGLTLIFEGFADRAYQTNGLLVPRSEPHAVHSTLARIVQQGTAFATREPITCYDGVSKLKLTIDSLCVHGDTDLALHAIEALYDALH